jgi:hypothetical protein
MLEIDETTAQVRKVAHRSVRSPRRRTPFEVWAWSPVSILRVALVITYLIVVGFAVTSFIAGVPVFELTTPVGYTAPWAVLLCASAIAAAIGAVNDHWRQLERWASLMVTNLLLPYVAALHIIGYISGDPNRQAVSWVALGLLVLPLTRFLWLASQAGKKHT